MNHALLISVRLHEGRYHGLGEELPAPARLFQALVAGSGLSGPLSEAEINALEWLERLDPPVIAAPRMWNGQSLTSYVPNNDLDTVAGDHRRIGSVKTSKIVRPRLFDAAIPLLFAWSFSPSKDSDALSRMICEMANRIYQFGRGVDFAWAWGETLDEDGLHSQLGAYHGRVYRPTRTGTGVMVACPQRGSWHSLKVRHEQGGNRFVVVGKGKSPRFQFTQAPKPRFTQIAYDSPPARSLFELRLVNAADSYSPFPLERSSQLVAAIRDIAVERLRTGLPDRVQDIERALIGRRSDGTNSIPAADRVRIIPLPSIGHFHADAEIRRVLVEVPATCPLRSDDVCWAISGLILSGKGAGSDSQVILRRADSLDMLSHYGINNGLHRTWRTVTPVVLPENASRRRIDPSRKDVEAKSGSERRIEQERGVSALVQSLRHADILTQVESIRLQREPFTAHGQRVEEFATDTRFAKERLWHTQITFTEPVTGPVIIGDGRFLGLGLMAPNKQTPGIHVFHVTAGLTDCVNSLEIAGAMRRAVLSRVQGVSARHDRLPPYFSGHDADGSPTSLPHLTYIYDSLSQRILVVAPHVACRQSVPGKDENNLELLDRALADMSVLRAGPWGVLRLASTSLEPATDPLFGTSKTWESVTDYVVTRHLSLSNSREAIAHNIQTECERLCLPNPEVSILETFGNPGVGLSGRARLTFPVAIDGPVIIGRNRHLGGGVFAKVDCLRD